MATKTYSNVFGAPKGNTPLTAPVPVFKTPQIPNAGGAMAFEISDMEQVKRFILLGSEGGSYYVGEAKLTKENADTTLRAIKANGVAVVDLVVEISAAGRAPKNDPALFVLALAMAFGDAATKVAVGEALPKVARIGTHLFHFAEYVDGMRGWGRGLRKAVAKWYTEGKESRSLAYDIVKYVQRDGWSHKDLLALTHPKTDDATRNAVFNYIVKGWPNIGEAPHDNEALQIIWAAERAKLAKSDAEILPLIAQYNLPMECIPTNLRSKAVYEALIPTSGITWLLRNLGNLSKTGAIATGQYSNLNLVIDRLTNVEQIRKGRVHPLAILVALNTYKGGKGIRGDSSWPVIDKVVTALDEAYYLSFDTIEPSGARYVLGCDVSPSMRSNDVAGMTGITASIGTGVMAMATLKVERNTEIMAFTSDLVKLNLNKKMRLDGVIEEMNRASRSWGGTDCSRPITWATANKIEADAFVIYTDNDTNSGIHPVEALKTYKQKMGIDAKLIVVSFTPNKYSIAPSKIDGPNYLDIAGFDTSTPAVISAFAGAGL